MENQVLENIRKRRSITRFEKYDISDEELEVILEAGRWAPSFANSQPWKFVVTQDSQTKKNLSKIASRVTISSQGVTEASAIIAVCVDPEEDPHHYVEDGAVASQNMALVAQSLGLASYWLGTYQIESGKGTAEDEIKNLLEIPEKYRLISLLPIGKPAVEKRKGRKDLEEIVFYEKFGQA